MIHALNGLFERQGSALAAQRSFIADAAHELRTPLTAVHLQAQLAERANTDMERKAALSELVPMRTLPLLTSDSAPPARAPGHRGS